MTRKYEVNNQLTGLLEEATTWEEAQQLRDRLRAEYIADRVDPLFIISVLTQNPDSSWSQTVADGNGDPIPINTGYPTQPAGTPIPVSEL